MDFPRRVDLQLLGRECGAVHGGTELVVGGGEGAGGGGAELVVVGLDEGGAAGAEAP